MRWKCMGLRHEASKSGHSQIIQAIEVSQLFWRPTDNYQGQSPKVIIGALYSARPEGPFEHYIEFRVISMMERTSCVWTLQKLHILEYAGVQKLCRHFSQASYFQNVVSLKIHKICSVQTQLEIKIPYHPWWYSLIKIHSNGVKSSETKQG